MKKNLKLSFILAAILVASSGCVSGNWQGLIPGKDVHLKNFKQEITTPWGHSIITADSLDTVVDSGGNIAIPATK